MAAQEGGWAAVQERGGGDLPRADQLTDLRVV